MNMVLTSSPKRESSPSLFLSLTCGSWLDWVILALSALAVFATAVMMLRPVLGVDSNLGSGLAAGVTVTTLASFAYWRHQISRTVSNSLLRLVDRPLWHIAVLGLFLRVAWVLIFPAQPGSDGGLYLDLALELSAGRPYVVAGTHATWPVGYPLFLTPWVALLSPPKLAYLAANGFVYITTLLGLAFLGRALHGSLAGKCAALVFALWPNLIFNTATPEKEMLVLAMLPWAFGLIVRMLKGQASRLDAILAGALLGGSTLIQPSLQFLPPVVGILLIGLRPEKSACLRGPLLLILGAVMVIAPWSARNYAVFDRFVLVSTNGGDVLYRANNPLATGGYTPAGEVDMSSLNELERDRLGRELAVKWIREHPGDFLRLAFEKQIRFMGDDAVGVYNTLKVGRGSDNGIVYALLKISSNLWWLLVWLTLAALILAQPREHHSPPALSRLPIWIWLYLLALHTIFESAGKYHIPALWVPCILIGLHCAQIACHQSRHELAQPRSQRG